MNQDGLYVTLNANGIIEKYLIANGKRIILEPASVQEEIISVSELNFKPYNTLVETLEEISENIFGDGDDFGTVYMERYESFLNTVYYACEELQKENPVYGVLLKTLLDDNVPQDDYTADYVRRAVNEIMACLKDFNYFYLHLHEYLYRRVENTELRFSDDFKEFTQITAPMISYFDGTNIRTEHFFRSLSQYYIFVLQRFIANQYKVCWCEGCGKYFVPKTKKKTLYCDRVLNNGKTCKQYAPYVKKKMRESNDEFFGTYAKIENKLRKRMERNGAWGDNYLEFCEWKNNANAVKFLYLDGKISAEDAVREIECE